MSAGAAAIDMAAERGGPTRVIARSTDRCCTLSHGCCVEEVLTLRVEDIGHLHRRPAHDCGGFRSSRTRHHRGGVDLTQIEGIGRGLKLRRGDWIHRHVREIGVAEQ